MAPPMPVGVKRFGEGVERSAELVMRDRGVHPKELVVRDRVEGHEPLSQRELIHHDSQCLMTDYHEARIPSREVGSIATEPPRTSFIGSGRRRPVAARTG